MTRRPSSKQQREQNYIAAINAERDAWVKRYGKAGWQAELDRRRAARIERSRARRRGAVPLPVRDSESEPSTMTEGSPQLSLDDLGATA